MGISLRNYQVEMIDKVRIALRSHKSVLLQSPTGSGKTALSAFMTGTAVNRGLRTLFICHRAELVSQTGATFDSVGISHSYCAAGRRFNAHSPALVCGIDTLKHRLQYVGKRDLIIWDEAHHTAAGGWRKVREAFPDAYHIGLSATPERLDGRGLDDLYETIVLGPSVRSLIEAGYLCGYRAFAPSAPQLATIKRIGGDYAKGQLEEIMDGPSITGDAIEHYRRLSMGKRAVCFCVSIEHSAHVAQRFREAGIPAVSLDGTTDRSDRADALERFRRGEIKVLCNVDLFGEGFDLPAIETAILLRPTKSLALFLQQVGRALRPFPGKAEALILDHAGNLMEHGLPDEDRTWSLEGRKKKAKEPSVAIRQCPKCFAVHAPGPVCTSCGYEYPVSTATRRVEEKAGQLEEIDVAQFRRQRVVEQAMASTLEELVELATARGYKSPQRWAAHVFTARQAKQELKYGS